MKLVNTFAISFVLFASIYFTLAQITVKCLDGNTEGKHIGPFNQPLSEAEKNTFYRVKGAPCITCEIDCLADLPNIPGKDKPGNPFVSCPCRYIRYGCLANQPCAQLNSTTPRQFDAAIQLCLAHGCVTKPDISSPNVDNKLYAYSPGQAVWKTSVRECYVPGGTNGEAYRRKRAYYSDLNTDPSKSAIDPNSSNAKMRSCELNIYRAPYESKLALFKAGKATQREILQIAYQYASFAIDPSSPFLMYQFLILSRGYDLTNTTQRTQLMSYVNGMLGNIHRDILARNALFKITDLELNSLVDQYKTCGFGKTRADAFTDMIDKFVISLQYRSACGGSATYLENYFDAQYKLLTQSLGISLNDLFDDQDMGRNFIYPFIFKTAAKESIVFADSSFTWKKISKSHYDFTDAKYPLCPTFAPLPQCVKNAIANNVAPEF